MHNPESGGREKKMERETLIKLQRFFKNWTHLSSDAPRERYSGSTILVRPHCQHLTDTPSYGARTKTQKKFQLPFKILEKNHLCTLWHGIRVSVSIMTNV